MNDIQNRDDVKTLVASFYAKIKVDSLLGPVFNAHIKEDQWAEHIEKLTDFWETNLFGIPKFKGSPTQKHINVDKNLNYTMSQDHFGRWLLLWSETIDELFQGELAQRAKTASQNMAIGQFLAVYRHRTA